MTPADKSSDSQEIASHSSEFRAVYSHEEQFCGGLGVGVGVRACVCVRGCGGVCAYVNQLVKIASH